jgi:ADP-ribose pyrophosphatase
MKKIIPADAVLIPDSAKRVFEGVIYDVYQWPQELYDGSRATFEMLRRPDTVGALCVVDNNILVLNDEQPLRGVRLSFPGGRVDEGEAGTQYAIKREVREETGYEFDNWRLVQVWQPHTKIEWFVYYYVAWGVRSEVAPHLDAGEKITVQKLPFMKAKELVLNKAGYLGEAHSLFETAQTTDDLLALPEYSGNEIERP